MCAYGKNKKNRKNLNRILPLTVLVAFTSCALSLSLFLSVFSISHSFLFVFISFARSGLLLLLLLLFSLLFSVLISRCATSFLFQFKIESRLCFFLLSTGFASAHTTITDDSCMQHMRRICGMFVGE